MKKEYFVADDAASAAAALLARTAVNQRITTASLIGNGYAVYVVIGSAYVRVASVAFEQMHKSVMESGFCVEHGMNTCSEDCPGRPVQEKPDETV